MPPRTRTTKKKAEVEQTSAVAVAELPKGHNPMAIRVDFTGADQAVKPLDAGPYQAKVLDVTLSEKAGPSGYHSVIIDWQVLDPKRKVRFDRYSLSPAALWRLKQVMTTLGVEVPDGEFEIDPDELKGQEATIVLKIEEFNGRENNRVEEVKPADPFA